MGRNILILLGYPGAGKGTQAKTIMRRLNIPQISTGDMLREEIAHGTPNGNEVKELMAAGKFVDDHIVDAIVSSRIRRPDCAKGFILDGYPRTVSQAETFSRELTPDDKFWVIEIAADPAHVMSRLLGRLMCPTCTEIYNVRSRVPKVDRLCDKCGSALVHRPDDVRDRIEERFLHYRAQDRSSCGVLQEDRTFPSGRWPPPATEVTRQLMALIDGEEVEGHMAAPKMRKGTIA
jgi:adenylate kinase